MLRTASLLVLLLGTGCVPMLAPNVDPVMWRCDALASDDPEQRDEALAYLEEAFIRSSRVEYKFVQAPQGRRIGERCLPPLARLLESPDAALRWRARAILHGAIQRAIQPDWTIPGAEPVVAALVRDTERLWKGVDLVGDEAAHRLALVSANLDALWRFGAQAEPAVPLARAIRAGPDELAAARERSGDPFAGPGSGWHPEARNLLWVAAGNAGWRPPPEWTPSPASGSDPGDD